MNVLICIVLHIIIMCLFVESGRIKRVIGGFEVSCGIQPRVFSLRNSTNLSHLCGATILTNEFAVTVAHCVHFTENNYFLQANNYCIADGASYPTAKVMEIITHAEYDRVTRAHDIALLRVIPNFDNITWLTFDDLLPNTSFGISGACTVYGYGHKDINTMETSENLLSDKLEIVSLDDCTEKLGPYVAPTFDSGMMCAVGDGVDTCQGDSGSPLICSDDLIQGISSYGMSCGVPGLPAVYTSIGAHINWIRNVIQT